MEDDIFPIIQTVVSYGHDYEKRIDEGDRVNCYMCKYPFVVNRYNVRVDENGMQFLVCPMCKARISVLYYFDKVNLPDQISLKPKRKQKSYVRAEMTNRAYGDDY